MHQWARRENGLEDLTTDEMDRVFKTNLYALFWVTQQALGAMGEGSSIINVSSIQAYDPSVPLIDSQPPRRRSTTSRSTSPPSSGHVESG
ncbi:SDR family oxidoreductase [Tessaracoccus flavescens]|uniref:SDR family oxidoreductase n=1 Tax=Tessaracoccus flavescens TaxID=399497 RepID=UPI002029F4A4|nr:SDR family oxidoreductase [Tessaracoccus flavescens]